MFAQSVTSPNIALVKYWGKYHDELILPINDSIGFTLNSEDLKTTTTILFSSDVTEDQLKLNGTNEPISKRLKKILKLAKQLGQKSTKLSKEEYNACHFRIQSHNSFPTASGMASSASGLSSIAVCLNKLFENCFDEKRVSQLARLGSGSASRSIYGGLVKWSGIDSYPKPLCSQQQLNEISKTCISQQILSASQLKSFKILILLANQKKKETSSTQGMKRSVQTSQLIKLRNSIARKRINTIIQAIKNNDINTFSETIIRDSNTFHSICLDTYPPIHYLSDFSKQVMSLVDHTINTYLKTKIAYTFDAGPHAFLFIHEAIFTTVFHFFLKLYNVEDSQLNSKGIQYKNLLNKNIEEIPLPNIEILKPTKLWVTDVGKGPMDLK